MNEKVFVTVVDNGARAMEQVYSLRRQGYLPEDIYILAHDRNRTDDLAEAANVSTVSVEEEGIMQSMANWFRSRGDELRAKLMSMGCTQREADAYEYDMDRGKLIVMAKSRVPATRGL
ncbi:general stress protein [Paenibacillus ginsengarvi]|uniref:General stress protein n=1 Tax=Paenibacillus ginsengarvi TaxID=400777 RepID=A0A3B0BF16_9BACL|nr:general stress protein [Paenibacillus ginsengarvi]RKN71252.1 general stress protein [Paenibacillus ginsengarvi]